jgi:hypothetical protein
MTGGVIGGMGGDGRMKRTIGTIDIVMTEGGLTATQGGYRTTITGTDPTTGIVLMVMLTDTGLVTTTTAQEMVASVGEPQNNAGRLPLDTDLVLLEEKAQTATDPNLLLRISLDPPLNPHHLVLHIYILHPIGQSLLYRHHRRLLHLHQRLQRRRQHSLHSMLLLPSICQQSGQGLH